MAARVSVRVQIVAHQLQALAQTLGERAPAAPVILGHAVLDRDHRVAPGQRGPIVGELGGAEGAVLVLQHIAAVLIQLAGGGIEGDRHLLAGLIARRADAGHEHLQGLLVGLQIGREAALVAAGGGQAPLLQRGLQRVEDLRAHAQALREGGGAERHDHELLEVHAVVGVGAAVEHVHHRHRQYVRLLAAQVAPQGQALLGGLRVGRRQRHPEDRIGAQARLAGGAIQRDQGRVQTALVGRVEAAHRRGDLALHVGHGARHALSPPLATAVAQLRGLELAGGCPRGHRRAAPRAAAQSQLDLHRGVAAAVEDLARVNLLDLAHRREGTLRA
jgi:hypothetical protein